MKRFLFFITLLGFLSSARAQIDVGLEAKRHMFLMGEPIEVTVTIRNLAGKDIMLRDVGDNQWFGFEVIRGGDTPIAPKELSYRNPPQVVLAGETIRRKVDISKLFPMKNYDGYKVRAAIYYHETGKYISSGAFRLDVGDGKRIWTRTVGVPASKPGAGEMRVMTLISFQLPREQTLYVRVEDEASGDIFGTYPLARYIVGSTPVAEFDNDNTLHVLQLAGTGQYLLSKIGINGEWLGQSQWDSAKGRAIIRRNATGKMVIVGATRANVAVNDGPPVPKLSDRPVVVPK